MYSLNSIFKGVAVKAKNVMLLGTAVVGTLLMSFTTVERNEAPDKSDKSGDVKLERVQVQEAGYNLKGVVEALAIIDPVWAKNLPKAKARNRKVEKATKAITITTRGVLDDEGTRYRITLEEADPGNPCGVSPTIPCRVTFDTSINVPYQEGGHWYVNKGEEEDGMETSGEGPYAD